MSEKSLSTTCRLCARKGLYDMFEHRLEIDEDNLILISEAFQIFSNAKVDNRTIAPLLCAYCTEELGQAYNFYIKVKLSESAGLTEADDDVIDPDMIEMVDEPEHVDEIIEEDLINKGDEIDNELNTDNEDFIEMIAAEDVGEDNEESNLVIYNEDVDGITSEAEIQGIEIPESANIPDKGTKKINKIPNIQLTSKVSTLLNRINKSCTLLHKRKASTIDMENSSTPRKVQKIDDNFNIMAPKFVLYETRFEDNVSDNMNDENNRISEIPDGSLFAPSSNESNDIKQNLNKRKMPALPTHKVTMDISAVRLEKNTAQLDIYSNLDKKEDASVLYQCSYCPKAFATQYHLGLHTQKVHVCQHCLTGFNKIQDLYAHVKAEHNTFICSFCNKQMSTNSNLRAHVRKIHGVALPAGVSLISLQK